MTDVATDPTATDPDLPEGTERSRSRGGWWRQEPRWVLLALGGIFVAYLAWLGGITLMRHRAWFTNTYDLAIFDQGIWMLSRLKDPFVSVRAVNLFGDHASLNLVLLAPLYRLWPFGGAYFLLIAQTVAMGATVFPLYRLARVVGARPGMALVPCGMFVICPLVQNVNAFDFHPEALSIPFLAWAVVAAWERRWLPYGVAVGLAMMAKEDLGFILFFLGLWLVLFRKERVVGLITSGVGLAWLVFTLYVFIPAFGEGGSIYTGRLARFGDGSFSIMIGLITHFDETLRSIFGSEGLPYLAKVLASVGFLPLLRPALLVPAIPTLLLNVLSGFPAQRELQTHYIAGALAFLFAATAVAVARLDEGLRETKPAPAVARRLTAFIVGAAFLPVLTTNWLFSDAQPDRPGFRPVLLRSAHTVRLEEAAALIPDGAPVAASYYLLPHLSGREKAYLFPLPFDRPETQPFAYEGADQQQRISEIRYVFLDQNDVYYSEAGLIGIFPNNAGESWQSLARYYRGWDILYDFDGIILARRP